MIPTFHEAVARVRFAQTYDFTFVDDADFQGCMHPGFIGGSIVLHKNLRDRSYLIPVYLHEVGHVLARSYGLEDTVDEAERVFHNRYFAVLVATMYRRAGCLRDLRIYDLGDTPKTGNTHFGEAPDDNLILSRLRYALERSARLAPLRFTMEDIAAMIARDVEADWLKVAADGR